MHRRYAGAMRVEPLPVGEEGSPAGFGAVVSGFPLEKALHDGASGTEDHSELLCTALREHGLLLFRGQALAPADELALAELFSSWVETRDLGFRKSYGDQQFRVPDFQAIRVLGNVVDEQGELRAVRVLRLCTLCGRL